MSGQPIELAKAEFPYLVQQEGVPVRSLITLTRTRNDEAYYNGEGTLFYLANGALEMTGDGDRPGILKVNHTFATDDEDDTSKIAWFEVQLVTFVSSWGYHLNFRGLLTQVQFWPRAKGVEDPFAGAVEKKGRTEYGYTKNTGYPYTPPPVVIPGLKLPLIVDISLDMSMEPERTAKWLRKSMISHRKARRDREREAREKAVKRAAELKARAARREKQLAWAQTEEGQEYERLRQEFHGLPTKEARDEWRKSEAHTRYLQLADALSDIE